MSSASATGFVVTTSAGGMTSSRLWDPSAPLTIGQFKWILERVPGGVRLRGLTKGNAHREIPDAAIAAGAQVLVSLGLSLTIRPVVKMAPVFAARPVAGGAMSIYECQGKWIRDSASLADEYVALNGSRKLFAVRQCGRRAEDPYEVEAYSETVTGLPAKGTRLTASELGALSIAFGERQWKFGSATAPEIPAVGPKARDAENDWFKKALRGAAIGLGAFVLMSMLWPKPNLNDELVPEQFAKIVLTAPSAKETTTRAGSESAPMRTDVAKDAPKAVRDSAVVSAFRAKALQNSVSGLLKGGMTSLLAQSDFVAGKSATSEARRIFDTRSAALGASGATGDTSARDVKVAALGGEGGNGKGSAKGYGKGEHAAVKGQGQSFVSMDIGAAAVAEGLTKDEVGEVIHRHLSEVRYCYESAMLRKPDLEGKLLVNFTIGGPGSVKSTEVKQSTLDEPRLDDCILRRLASWKFPNPRGGIDVAVSYPFIFKTLGR